MKKNKIRGGVSSQPPDALILGNRIPRDYFITTGSGQSDITVHAGSYHLAMKAAGIERANLMMYSSILPCCAKQISQPKDYTHGEVMETIMAVAHGGKGERISAGISFGRLYHKKTGKKFGGLVCEHNGNYTIAEIKKLLQASLHELYINGFDKLYDLKQIKVITETFVPTKTYGSVLVALCFKNYIFPIISK